MVFCYGSPTKLIQRPTHFCSLSSYFPPTLLPTRHLPSSYFVHGTVSHKETYKACPPSFQILPWEMDISIEFSQVDLMNIHWEVPLLLRLFKGLSPLEFSLSPLLEFWPFSFLLSSFFLPQNFSIALPFCAVHPPCLPQLYSFLSFKGVFLKEGAMELGHPCQECDLHGASIMFSQRMSWPCVRHDLPGARDLIVLISVSPMVTCMP